MTILGLGKLGFPTIGIHEPSLSGSNFSMELYTTYNKIGLESPIGQSTTSRLQNDERVIALQGKMLTSGGGATRFENASLLTDWWLWRANDVGPDQANQELETFLDSDDIKADAVLWVYGVQPTQRIHIGDDIQFVSIKDMPDSSDKEAFLMTRLRFHGAINSAPAAALVKRYTTRKFARGILGDGPEPGVEDTNNALVEAHETLNTISIVLNCINGVCCMQGYGTSYLSPETPLGPFGGSGGGMPVFDVLPKRILHLGPGHEEKILALATRYIEKSHNDKIRLARALHRLAQAKSRLDDGDRALDLGIALEMMLLNAEHGGQALPGQLTLHFRLRGSWLIGETADERKSLYHTLGKIYNLRSQLAHNGFSDELNKMNYETRNKMLDEHMRVAERIFQKMILDVNPKDWMGLILGD